MTSLQQMIQKFEERFVKARIETVNYTDEQKGHLLHSVMHSYFRHCKPYHYLKTSPFDMVYIWNRTQGISVADVTDIVDSYMSDPSSMGLENKLNWAESAIFSAISSRELNPNVKGVFSRVSKKAVSPVSVHHHYADSISNIELTCKQRLMNIYLEYGGVTVFQDYKEIKTDDGYRYFFEYAGIPSFHFPNMIPIYEYFRQDLTRVLFSFREAEADVQISYRAYIFSPKCLNPTPAGPGPQGWVAASVQRLNEYLIIPIGRENYFLMAFDFMEMAAFPPPFQVSRWDSLADFTATPEYQKLIKQLKEKKATFLLGLSPKVAPEAPMSRHFNGPLGERNIFKLIVKFMPEEVD